MKTVTRRSLDVVKKLNELMVKERERLRLQRQLQEQMCRDLWGISDEKLYVTECTSRERRFRFEYMIDTARRHLNLSHPMPAALKKLRKFYNEYQTIDFSNNRTDKEEEERFDLYHRIRKADVLWFGSNRIARPVYDSVRRNKSELICIPGVELTLIIDQVRKGEITL